jgi:hypothetical protein
MMHLKNRQTPPVNPGGIVAGGILTGGVVGRRLCKRHIISAAIGQRLGTRSYRAFSGEIRLASKYLPHKVSDGYLYDMVLGKESRGSGVTCSFRSHRLCKDF